LAQTFSRSSAFVFRLGFQRHFVGINLNPQIVPYLIAQNHSPNKGNCGGLFPLDRQTVCSLPDSGGVTVQPIKPFGAIALFLASTIR